MHPAIPIDRSRIAEFCRKWQVREFALVGSVLREDFGPESDVDVMLDFAEGTHWTLFNLVDMEDELQAIFGRHVDLLTRPGVEGCRNPARRREILSTSEVVYAA